MTKKILLGMQLALVACGNPPDRQAVGSPVPEERYSIEATAPAFVTAPDNNESCPVFKGISVNSKGFSLTTSPLQLEGRESDLGASCFLRGQIQVPAGHILRSQLSQENLGVDLNLTPSAQFEFQSEIILDGPDQFESQVQGIVAGGSIKAYQNLKFSLPPPLRKDCSRTSATETVVKVELRHSMSIKQEESASESSRVNVTQLPGLRLELVDCTVDERKSASQLLPR